MIAGAPTKGWTDRIPGRQVSARLCFSNGKNDRHRIEIPAHCTRRTGFAKPKFWARYSRAPESSRLSRQTAFAQRDAGEVFNPGSQPPPAGADVARPPKRDSTSAGTERENELLLQHFHPKSTTV